MKAPNHIRLSRVARAQARAGHAHSVPHAGLRGCMVAIAFLLLPAAFLFLHLEAPSDGARLEPGEQVWKADGVIVTPLDERPDGLRSGDVVVALEGRSLDSWAQAIFDPNMPRPNWQLGQAVTYTVIRDGQRLDLQIPLKPYAWSAVLAKNWSTILFTLFSQLVATFAFLVKPQDRAARALFLWAWSLSHTYSWSLGLQVSDMVGGIGFWLYQAGVTGAWLIFWSASLDFALVFPQPHPILRKRPWLTWLNFLLPFPLFLLYLALMWSTASSRLDWLGRWTPGDWLFAFVFQVLALVAVVDGYRSGYDRAARQKVRWLILAFMLGGGIGLGLWFLPGIIFGQPLISASALGLALLPFPLVLAIAILRHQLFDIDIIIRRTLIYGVMTALLALVYFSSVVVLQAIFRTLIGQAQSEIVTVISTLLIAALFVPLRRRVQAFIDRRFYRRKYDTAQVIAAFSATARDVVELDKLTDQLLQVVDETMQPTHVSLWLRKTK